LGIFGSKFKSTTLKNEKQVTLSKPIFAPVSTTNYFKYFSLSQ